MPSTVPPGISKLSIRGRLAVALHLFARYCRRRGLAHPEIDAFAEHLWRFIGLRGPLSFGVWQEDEPGLVGAGLGWEYPDGFEAFLSGCGVPEAEFRRVLACTTEVLFISMFGAANEAGSRRFLCELAAECGACGVGWPAIDRFAHSCWGEDGGWGRPLSQEALAAWREAPDES